MMPGEFSWGQPPLTEREAMMLSPIRLAYVGDAVYDLLVRTALVFAGGKAGAMHKDAIRSVNAAAQAQALRRVLGMLTEAEADIVRRGRNAHAHHADTFAVRMLCGKKLSGGEIPGRNRN